MNGPRLQVNMIDGLENIAAEMGVTTNGAYTVEFQRYQETSVGTDQIWNRHQWRHPYILVDKWDGSQSIMAPGANYPASQATYIMYACRYRLALRTEEDPNTYIVVSVHQENRSNIIKCYYAYYTVGKRISVERSVARTFTVKLDTTKWRRLDGEAYTSNKSRGNANIWAGTSWHFSYENNTSNNADGRMNNQNGYITRLMSSNTAIITFEFPANCNAMREQNTPCYFNEHLADLNGRKYGNLGDALSDDVAVQKVWSPQKNCLSLKNLFNGEIPIFNE